MSEFSTLVNEANKDPFRIQTIGIAQISNMMSCDADVSP